MPEINESNKEDEIAKINKKHAQELNWKIKLDSLTEQKLHVLKNKDIDFTNLNQGIYRDRWYFGKLFNDGDKPRLGIVLSSKHIAIGHEALETIGLNRHNELELQRTCWSNEDIERWLNSSEKIDKRRLYEQIRGRILHYMDFTDGRIADLCTCWIIGTYCYELFESYGYLYFNAFRNSGKTKIKNILKFMGFNSIEASNISESAFFRTIENRKGVLCLDEYEKMDDTRKKILDQLLNAGHMKNAAVVRSEKIGDNWIAREFNVYCPKIICNITGINQTTQSRCITIKLMRTMKEQGKRQVRFDDLEWQDIRNKCYRLVMENWKEINQIYEEYSNSKLLNRDEDTWKPLFSIARFFGEDVEKTLIEYSTTNIEESSLDSLEGDWKYELLKAIHEQVKDQGDGWYFASQIGTWLTRLPCIKSPERWAGRQLSKMPLFKKRKTAKGNEWYLSLSIVKDAMTRLGYPCPDDEYTNSSDSTNVIDSDSHSNTDEGRISGLDGVSEVENIDEAQKVGVFCEEKM
jgi:hypothetical protein